MTEAKALSTLTLNDVELSVPLGMEDTVRKCWNLVRTLEESADMREVDAQGAADKQVEAEEDYLVGLGLIAAPFESRPASANKAYVAAISALGGNKKSRSSRRSRYLKRAMSYLVATGQLVVEPKAPEAPVATPEGDTASVVGESVTVSLWDAVAGDVEQVGVSINDALTTAETTGSPEDALRVAVLVGQLSSIAKNAGQRASKLVKNAPIAKAS